MTNLEAKDKGFDLYPHTIHNIMELNKQLKDDVVERKISIGSIVRVIDGSVNIDAKTKQKRNGVEPLFKNHKAKVIANDLFILPNRDIILNEYDKYDICNLLIVFEKDNVNIQNDIYIYINSDMISVKNQL